MKIKLQTFTSTETSYMKRLSFLVVGPSLAGSSEILMASSMAANRPAPPSPLRAGPKHSGRRINRRTTTLAFSSTLSPAGGDTNTKFNYECLQIEESETEFHLICSPFTNTAKRRKSRYLSPPPGFHPMSG